MKIDGDTITFSSGRTTYANCGIVGLSDRLTVSQGSDGGIGWPPYDAGDHDDLTAADMVELADHMIEQWGRFKKSVA